MYFRKIWGTLCGGMAGPIKQYWAFISYSSRDEKVARRLHEALENYRIPKELVGISTRDGEPVPRRLFPVFRDREELPLSSDLGGSIEDALRASRHLIVLCSPGSAKSRWVNDEVRHFKQMGGASRILAIIVAGQPNASEEEGAESLECFPTALRYRVLEDGSLGPERCEPVAGDLRPGGDGWKSCLLKSVAGITGISLAAFTRREQVRSRWLWSLAILLAVLFSGLLYGVWDYTRIQKVGYAVLSERFGVPFGVTRLNAKAIAKIDQFCLVESSRGKVRRVSSLNSRGVVCEASDVPASAGVRELIYREDGSLQMVIFKNRLGRVLLRQHFGELTPGPGGAGASWVGVIRNEDADGAAKILGSSLVTDPLSSIGNTEEEMRTEISTLRVEYDARGFPMRRFYLDAFHRPRANSSGAFGVRLETNSSGLILRETLLGEDGEPCPNRIGVQTVRYGRSASGQTTSEAFFGQDGKPEPGPDGYHRAEWVLNEALCYAEEAFYDTAGRPTHEKSLGAHRLLRSYDSRGALSRICCVDAQGAPALTSENWAMSVFENDDLGRCVAISYFGVDGKPALNSRLHHKVVFQRDASGNEVEIAFFGIHGDPAPGGDGIAAQKKKYDTLGNEIERTFFGRDGKPFTNSEGIAGVRNKLNSLGLPSVVSFVGVDGKPVANRLGQAGYLQKFDARGNQIEVAYFGIDGKPVAEPNRVGSWTRKYDSRGYNTEIAFFGVDGKPVLDNSGVSGWTTKFDERGNAIQRSYFGTDRKLILHRDGVAGCNCKFDNHGNEVERSYFGINGEPVAINKGVAKTTQAFDSRGNSVELNLLGLDGKPVMNKDEISKISRKFDVFGNEVESRRYGTFGEPTVNTSGFHLEAKGYDSRSKLVWEEWRDISGQYVLNTQVGAARRDLVYNEKGWVVETRLSGVDGKPVNGKQGWAREVVAFDPRTGLEKSRIRHKADGAPLR